MTNILLEVDEGLERFEPLAQAVCAAVQKALEQANGPELAQIGLFIVDDEAIHEMNREHRGVDNPTDVLSFPMLEPGQTPAPTDLDPETGEVLLGDIVISLPTAERQAQEYGHSLAREAAYLAVHGTLHLLGLDHEDDAAREEMRRYEEAAMTAVGLTR